MNSKNKESLTSHTNIGTKTAEEQELELLEEEMKEEKDRLEQLEG